MKTWVFGGKHLLTGDSVNTHVGVSCSHYLTEEFPGVPAVCLLAQDCPKHVYYLAHKMY